MRRSTYKIALYVIAAMFLHTHQTIAQDWTFPYPTTGAPCSSCVPAGWTMVTGSPDLSSLDDWIGYPHHEAGGVISPVPEPTPGVTSFMSAMAYGGGSEVVTTTFTLAVPRTLTVYFGGFGTNISGGGPGGAQPGMTINLLVNGVSTSVPVPWDGGWTEVTYSLPAGSNTITLDPSIGDDDNRHVVHISIPAEQVSPCEDNLVLTASAPEICLGDELTLTAESPSGAEVTWDLGAPNGVAFTPADAGVITYTATSESEDECPATIDITIHELPIIDAGADVTICEGEDVILSGAGGSTYDWTDGVVDGVAFSPAVTNTYTVTGTDDNGCENTDDVEVVVNPIPTIDAGEDLSICLGDDVVLSGTGAGVGGTYDWTGGVTDGVAFAPAVTTTYTLTGTDANGCVNTDDVEVAVNPSPTIDAGMDTEICNGDAVTLTGSGAGVGGSYSWSDGVIDGAPFNPVTTTTYTVTGTDANGCENTDNVTVTVNGLPEVSFTGDNLMGCPKHLVQFNTASPGASYEWEFGDGATSTVEDPAHTYTTAGLYDVTLTVTSAEGCETTITYSDYVDIRNKPEASFTYVTSSSSFESSTIDFDNTSINSDTYDWRFGDGTVSNDEDPMHTYASSNNAAYTVTLIAENSIGCADTARQIIQMEGITIYYIPNTFTPDGDSFNETFQPVFSSGYDIYDFHMMIFNRWGEVVFETYNADYGWNGTYGDGGLVDDGVYVWRIDFGDSGSDARHTEEGHVTVIK